MLYFSVGLTIVFFELVFFLKDFLVNLSIIVFATVSLLTCFVVVVVYLFDHKAWDLIS